MAMPQLMMLLGRAAKFGKGAASQGAAWGRGAASRGAAWGRGAAGRAADYGGAYSARNVGSYGAKRAGEIYASNPRAFQIGGAALGGAALGSMASGQPRDRFGHGIESRSDSMSNKQVMDKLEAAARYVQKGEDIPNEILESLMGLNPIDFSQDAGSSLAAFQSYIVAPQEPMPPGTMY